MRAVKKNAPFSKNRPVVLHMVTWYPSSEDSIDGIFTRRQIELLHEDISYRHIIVQQSISALSVFNIVKGLIGFYTKSKINGLTKYQFPSDESYNRTIFGKWKNKIKELYISRFVCSIRPSILHLHVVYGFGKIAVQIWNKYKIPFLVSEHMAPFPFLWLNDLDDNVKIPISKAKYIVAVSHAQAKQISDFTGVTPIVIPNYVNPNEFYHQEITLNCDQLNLIFVGIYDARKGVDYLLNVLPGFLDLHPNTVLHLVGGCSESRMNELESIIKTYNLEKFVVFHGKLSPHELSDLFNVCNFYICSSEWESFGVSVLEALFAGLPVLSTNCGGVVDFINEENGMIVENDRNLQTLLHGMLEMVNRRHEFNRGQISANISLKFSGDLIKVQYLSVYKKMLFSAKDLVV